MDFLCKFTPKTDALEELFFFARGPFLLLFVRGFFALSQVRVTKALMTP